MTRDINLLPAEEGKRRPRGRLWWVVAGLAYAGLLFVIGLSWDSKIDDAEGELAAQQQIADDVRAQIADLASLAQLQNEFQASRNLVSALLANDIAWGRVLNDLSRMIPDRVWLTSLTGGVAEGEDGPAQLRFSGVAFDYPDVGAWLRSLDSLAFPTVTATWVTDASRTPLGGTTVVEFGSTATLTDAALAGRLNRRIPELP